MLFGYEYSAKDQSDSDSFISSSAQSLTDRFPFEKRGNPSLAETVDRLAHCSFILGFSPVRRSDALKRGDHGASCPLLLTAPTSITLKSDVIELMSLDHLSPFRPYKASKEKEEVGLSKKEPK